MNLLTFTGPLHNLNPDQSPEWGTMTPRHMVEHLALAVRLSNGKLTEICAYPDNKLPAMKRFLMSDKPMPRNFVNPVIGEGLKPLISSSLEEAIRLLDKELKTFYTWFDQNPDAKPVNPTFGPLDQREWEQFHQKHFKHHFAQFGLEIPGVD